MSVTRGPLSSNDLLPPNYGPENAAWTALKVTLAAAIGNPFALLDLIKGPRERRLEEWFRLVAEALQSLLEWRGT